jgi:hypothetical protein
VSRAVGSPAGMRPQPESPRFAAVRRRARNAKFVIGASGALVFGFAVGLARVSYAGHSKQPEHPLLSPQPLYDVVKRNLLQVGAMMPATEPPEATTHSS